jgi:DNA-3-methyladenine glycosylase I
MEEKPKTCWKTEDPLRIKYHDEEWGVPLHDDNRFFEFLALGGFQAGLTWWLVLKKRKSLREAFDNFDPRKVANYDTPDIECLMRNQGSALACC